MIGSTKWTCNVSLMRYISFLSSKKLQQHQKTLLFKNGVFYYKYVHQFVTILARTDVYYIYIIYIWYDIIYIYIYPYIFPHTLVVLNYLPKLKRDIMTLVVSAYFLYIFSIKIFLTKYHISWRSFNIRLNFFIKASNKMYFSIPI